MLAFRNDYDFHNIKSINTIFPGQRNGINSSLIYKAKD